MKRLTAFIHYFFLLLTSHFSLAQFEIDYPVDRMVIQRNSQNIGQLQIAGHFTEYVDSIEVKLNPVNSGQGRAYEWKTIIKTPEKAQFISTIPVQGGWYQLSARSYYNGVITKETLIPHVGIGEVFIIAGQSNAEGNTDFQGSEIGTSEDRVSVIDYKDILMNEDELPFEFVPLKNNVKIGPYHPIPWFWGRMAEKIVKEYNVPVLLFGASVGGTGSDLWHGSMIGTDFSKVLGRQVKFPGSPYGVIKRTLQNYISRTGARALLWQQGESDAFTPPYLYYNRIREVVEQTSVDIDAPLSWIMAIGSRTPNPTQAAWGQQLLIDNVDKVFEGPNTDVIWGGENRADGIHFHQDGLNKVAELWSQAIIDNNYVQKLNPVLPKPFIEIDVNCNSTSFSNLSLLSPNGYDSPTWQNLAKEHNFNLQTGKTQLKARKNGVVYFSPSIALSNSAFSIEGINVNGSTEYCEGDFSNNLHASFKNVNWNSGEKTTSISPQQSGEYFFQWKNLYGCANISISQSVVVNPKPQPALKYSTGSTYFCENESIGLGTENPYSNYFWSNGETNANTSYEVQGEQYLIVESEKACLSDTLNFKLQALPAPLTPEISLSTPFTISSVDNQNLVWFKNEEDLNWSSSQWRLIEDGQYSAKSREIYTFENNLNLVCFSDFSNVIQINKSDIRPPIQIWPNPTTEQIFIDMKEYQEDLNLTIMDTSGKTVFSSVTKYQNGQFTPQNVSHLPPGLYMVKLGSRSNYVSHKLIIH
ncbi:T9SS type A sorting domain-containing protein [Jiulongibacter sp. NS-SX5]|uniref:T9SS type A sorting domain-containing protein n=1 Tax=Jiulongibacter sp. NS-SX5 TaxID=3463854 RepID=UPI004057E4AD